MVRLPRFGRSESAKPAEENVSAAQNAGETASEATAKAPKKRFSWGFVTDRSRRMRTLIWATAALFIVAGVMIVALGATSSYWFCSQGCHKVQDDTIMAYQHSVHNRVSCMSCHMPVNASPVTFMLHKVEALGELYMTVTNNYELPLNPESEVSLTMKSAQCTQCHTTNRKVTPSDGILINHEKHADNDVNCTVCHNRVAHVEDFRLKGVDPKTGKPNQKHEEFMTMTACFRCHSQEKDAKATGACEACHPKNFDLKPDFHKTAGFFPAEHGKLALEAEAEVRRAEAIEKRKAEEAEQAAAPKTQQKGSYGAQVAVASEAGATHDELPNVKTINPCFTCHDRKFCTDCHGVVMPHPADFKKQHGKIGKKDPKPCVQCHGAANIFCDKCHHGREVGYDYQDNQDWRTQQHPQAVAKTGAAACFPCHQPTYCAECHVNGGTPKK